MYVHCCFEYFVVQQKGRSKFRFLEHINGQEGISMQCCIEYFVVQQQGRSKFRFLQHTIEKECAKVLHTVGTGTLLSNPWRLKVLLRQCKDVDIVPNLKSNLVFSETITSKGFKPCMGTAITGIGTIRVKP
jgi:hypothetical protein